MSEDHERNVSQKDRTEYNPLYCEECGTRIVITADPSRRHFYYFECGCETRHEDDAWTEPWTLSVAREDL